MAVVPEHVLAVTAQAREDEAHRGETLGGVPTHIPVEDRHDSALAFGGLLHLEPLLVVDVLDLSTGHVREPALCPARVARGIALGTLERAVEALACAAAVAIRHLEVLVWYGHRLLDSETRGMGHAQC